MENFNDLQGTIQMAALLTVPVLTLGVVSFQFEKPTGPYWRRVLLMSILLFVLGGLAGFRLHDLGNPVAQLAIPLFGILGSAFLGRARLQFGFAMIMLIVGVGLSGHYAYLVQERYVGIGDWVNTRDESRVTSKDRVIAFLEEQSGVDPNEYSEGFLYDDHGVLLRYPELRRMQVGATVDRSELLWHSWVTKLYARRKVEVGQYYPGGLLKDGAAGIEWRVIPEEPFED